MPTKHSDDQNNEEMGGACGTYRVEEKCIQSVGKENWTRGATL